MWADVAQLSPLLGPVFCGGGRESGFLRARAADLYATVAEAWWLKSRKAGVAEEERREVVS